MHSASYYKQLDNCTVQCHLCPHLCMIEDGSYGKCNTRENKDGKLYTKSYGVLSAISTDPIEKKPLYHFMPGSSILSIGSFGCNLTCNFCQNCEISQIDSKVLSHHPSRDPADIVHKAALHQDNIGLAYTYNEPTIYFEYMIQCAELIQNHGLKNVMVTNGYINRKPLETLLPLMDAFNIDLKSFRDDFYRKISGAQLKPVLKTIERISGSGCHMELTFLIIPGLNDTESEWKKMISWISDHCGKDTVIHVSRYFPRYQLKNPPTPIKTIQLFMDMAREKINFLYPGNTLDQLDSHTYCPDCHSRLIDRTYYHATVTGIDTSGQCRNCHSVIYGLFNKL